MYQHKNASHSHRRKLVRPTLGNGFLTSGRASNLSDVVWGFCSRIVSCAQPAHLWLEACPHGRLIIAQAANSESPISASVFAPKRESLRKFANITGSGAILIVLGNRAYLRKCDEEPRIASQSGDKWLPTLLWLSKHRIPREPQ